MKLESFLSSIVYEDIVQIISLQFLSERFKNKTIFISGANGFLASYLIYYFLMLNDLCDTNCYVMGLCRNKQKAEKKFANLLERSDFNLVIGDVSTPIIVNSKIDFIVHAASPASPIHYGTDPVGVINANVLGTHSLLNLAQAQKVESFLFFSSGEVYGEVSPDKIPTKENEYGYIDINALRSCYSESKRLGETMCVGWCCQYNIPAKIVRPFHTYGPGMDLEDGRVYADFVANIVRGSDISMKSDGLAKRAFCYLRDATEGFIRVLLNGENGQAYNVGNPLEEISIKDLAETLVQLFPEKKLRVIKQPQKTEGYIQSSVMRNSPNIEKIEKLGWVPSIKIEEGFKRTIMSYL